MIKLISVQKSNHPDKKYMATFETEHGKKITHFGAAGMDDYTLTGDKAQRDRYRTRHAKDLETRDPTHAGYLSYYLLWGDSTSLQSNIQAFKKKFNV